MIGSLLDIFMVSFLGFLGIVFLQFKTGFLANKSVTLFERTFRISCVKGKSIHYELFHTGKETKEKP